MALRPEDWNVVIVGRWNRAILTPSWIAKQLFELAENTPVEVLFPLDVVAPYQVRHDGLVVVPSDDRLVVAPSECTRESFDRAKSIATRALTSLPRTPVSAAGINFRYVTDDQNPAIDGMLSNPIDGIIADQEFQISGRTITRSLVVDQGHLNWTVSVNRESKYKMLFNFDLKSTETEAITRWLSVPTANLHGNIVRLLRNILDIELPL